MGIAEMLAKQKNEQDNLRRSTVGKSFITNQVVINNSGIEIIDLPLIITGQSIGNSWIVGSPMNGIVGTNTGTFNGSQQVVGSAGRATDNIAISNPNKNWRTLLTGLETAYWDDTALTSCDVSTATQILNFANDNPQQMFQSNRLTMEASNIISATLSASNITNVANLTFYLSPDDGVNWEQVTLGTLHVFTNPGVNLKLKIVASLDFVTTTASISINDTYGVSTPIQIKYTI